MMYFCNKSCPLGARIISCFRIRAGYMDLLKLSLVYDGLATVVNDRSQTRKLRACRQGTGISK
jgi:hypothetical protein